MHFIYFLLLCVAFESDVQAGYNVEIFGDHNFTPSAGADIDKNSLYSVEDLKNFQEKPDRVRDANVQYKIGLSYLLGSYSAEGEYRANEKRAVKWLKRSVAQGNSKAMIRLGYLYKERGSFSKAVRYFSKATKEESNKDPAAFLEMAYVFEEGIGRFVNIEKATGYYHKAADFGSIEAHKTLAKWAINGALGVQDFPKAVEHYKVISDLSGDVSVKRNMAKKIAELYIWIGQGKNLKERVDWLLKAAELGNVTSYIQVASAYQNGQGVEVDMIKAVQWYTKAASVGNVKAMVLLGYLYANGLDGLEEDFCEAQKWYLQAAEANNADAAWNLGNFYRNGICVQKDKELAKKWFDRSVELAKKISTQ